MLSLPVVAFTLLAHTDDSFWFRAAGLSIGWADIEMVVVSPSHTTLRWIPAVSVSTWASVSWPPWPEWYCTVKG